MFEPDFHIPSTTPNLPPHQTHSLSRADPFFILFDQVHSFLYCKPRPCYYIPLLFFDSSKPRSSHGYFRPTNALKAKEPRIKQSYKLSRYLSVTHVSTNQITMRASVVIQVFLGAGALAHPHVKLSNPLAHEHHKRQQPVEILTTTVGNVIEIEDIYVATVWDSPPPSTTTPAPTSTPPVVVVAAPVKLAVAPVENKQSLNEDNQNWNHPSHSLASATPASMTPVSVTPKSITPSIAPASITPIRSTPAAAASTASSGNANDGAPKSGGVSILETANKYRILMGYSPFTYSSTLATNSAKTNADNGANAMLHELNSGSSAQCIAQVDNNTGSKGLSPFELTYLGWLCEIQDAKIGTVCQVMLDATNMQINYADPGHAEILRRPNYSQIGCNYLISTQHHDNYAGMWTCDFK
jgi:uncharacterized protein YkwD